MGRMVGNIHALIWKGIQLAEVLGVERRSFMMPVTHATCAVERRLTKIFALGIPTLPAHVLVHAGPHAEEVCIAALDGQGGGDGEDCSGQGEQPGEAHRGFCLGVERPDDRDERRDETRRDDKRALAL
jgi:hypothetical protein